MEQSSIQTSLARLSPQTTIPRAACSRKSAPCGLQQDSFASSSRSSTKTNSHGSIFLDEGDRSTASLSRFHFSGSMARPVYSRMLLRALSNSIISHPIYYLRFTIYYLAGAATQATLPVGRQL